MSAAASRRALSLEPAQFDSGLRLLAAERGSAEPLSHPSRPTIRFDLIRPEDLVVLTVEAVGCELVDGEPPRLRALADASPALLIVHYPFQHLAEQAFYEGGEMPKANEWQPDAGPLPVPPTGADPRPYPPVEVRAARGSRLVFRLDADDEVPFTTEGVLAAMARLEPVLHTMRLRGTRRPASRC